MSPSTPALELRDVTSGYGRTVVLREVSVTVPAGQVTAMLGPNGAGKTTLLRTVSGFIRPQSGSVHLFGDDVTTAAPYRRFEAGLCHVPEGRGVFRSLTIRENLVMQARKGQERAAIERATDAFPILGSRLGQTAGTLSGGEQQMLAMASAYVREPRLILVDEASLGLAPLIVDHIFAFMERVAREGSALLIVDQFATRALAMADRAYVLSRGSITYAGSPDGLGEDELMGHYLGG
ncbi:MAG TPA: ABC transporter ATP-binding protein [Acidimicrobiales bacterium]|nr:ABC transporter ATP-binding protein [Acidimicrobiales bacterium]